MASTDAEIPVRATPQKTAIKARVYAPFNPPISVNIFINYFSVLSQHKHCIKLIN